MLFLFTNDTSSVRHSQVQGGHGQLSYYVNRLKNLGLEIVPVVIGGNALADDLKDIASMPDRVISCGVNEDPSKLGRKLLRGNHSIAYFFMRTPVLLNKCRLEGQVILEYSFK